jgi:hypothetical protein
MSLRDFSRRAAKIAEANHFRLPLSQWFDFCYRWVMNDADEKRIAAKLAKIMGMMCVRNTILEGIHEGIVPISKTGDYSDVVVTDATGRHIPWSEVSHFDDDVMRDLMRQIVNRLYTFHMNTDNLQFHEQITRWMSVAGKWDDPELDEVFLQALNRSPDVKDD